MKHPSSEKPNSIDASHLFKQPHRVGRPDHVVIILRGLPGSFSIHVLYIYIFRVYLSIGYVGIQ